MRWQVASLADQLGDYVVYRSLEPADPCLTGLHACWREIGFSHYAVPRKGSAEHAAYLRHLLQEAASQRGAKQTQRLLVVGDTLSGDGAVAAQLGQMLPSWAFIGNQRLDQPSQLTLDGRIGIATRWESLGDYVAWLEGQGFSWDNTTALLLDLDKSLIGARGRNDHVIDEARVAAVRETVCDALMEGCYDEIRFRALYDALNKSKYHFLTEDNQDYLAYICLMVEGGVIPADEFWLAVNNQKLESITQFTSWCESRRDHMPTALAAAHVEVCDGLKREDPTPFKRFRRAEYLQTIRRMNVLAQDADEADVLAQEIVITAEVFSFVRVASERGAVVIGISDKPDEASLPSAEQEKAGYKPLHRTPMKIFGTPVFG